MTNEIGKRLRDERERLGLDQAQFASLVGVTRNSQSRYEISARTPNTTYFQKLKEANICADVRYITEGKYTYQEIGERLREERTLRLKQNTKGMAELGGITPELQNEYEMGLQRPPADYLNRISKAGAETWYILTGERDTNDPQLTAKEQELLNGFRRCSAAVQDAILLMAENSAIKEP